MMQQAARPDPPTTRGETIGKWRFSFSWQLSCSSWPSAVTQLLNGNPITNDVRLDVSGQS
jgi:hypothetical protein